MLNKKSAGLVELFYMQVCAWVSFCLTILKHIYYISCSHFLELFAAGAMRKAFSLLYEEKQKHPMLLSLPAVCTRTKSISRDGKECACSLSGARVARALSLARVKNISRPLPGLNTRQSITKMRTAARRKFLACSVKKREWQKETAAAARASFYYRTWGRNEILRLRRSVLKTMRDRGKSSRSDYKMRARWEIYFWALPFVSAGLK
jgi:hypothetical protein